MKMEIAFNRTLGQDESENRVLTIVRGLADLKDNLKRHAKQKGVDPELIEDGVNGSEYLQLIVDLENGQKHGYPPKPERSGKSPRLEDVTVGLQGQTSETSSTGEIMTLGNVKVIITASVVDKDSKSIMTLDMLIEGALNAWTELINKHGLL
jgi:hypothetical protein